MIEGIEGISLEKYRLSNIKLARRNVLKMINTPNPGQLQDIALWACELRMYCQDYRVEVVKEFLHQINNIITQWLKNRIFNRSVMLIEVAEIKADLIKLQNNLSAL